MPGARRFRGVPYLTLNSAILKQKYCEGHWFSTASPKKYQHHQDEVFTDTPGYLEGCGGQGGGDCDGDFTDWHNGLDDVTKLLTKVEE